MDLRIFATILEVLNIWRDGIHRCKLTSILEHFYILTEWLPTYWNRSWHIDLHMNSLCRPDIFPSNIDRHCTDMTDVCTDIDFEHLWNMSILKNVNGFLFRHICDDAYSIIMSAVVLGWGEPCDSSIIMSAVVLGWGEPCDNNMVRVVGFPKFLLPSLHEFNSHL